MRTWLLLFICLGLLLVGCTSPAQPTAANNTTSANTTTANVTIAANTSTGPASANVSANTNQTPADPIVEFDTTKGNFTAVIYVNEAPITAGNFMKLVRMGFYNNLTFHRVIPGFVAQGGDPLGTGAGGSGTNIPLEIVPGLTHQLGALAMARASDPNSASSQFYIVLNAANCASLDGQYAVFGRLTGPDQMAVVNSLAPGQPPAVPDRMIRVFEKTS